VSPAEPFAPPSPVAPDRPARRLAGITRNVVALGTVSLLNDVSSEMILPVLPLFVTGVLGASVASLGIIEGVAEATAALLRLSSGWFSDRIGRRKPFLMFGYGLSGAAKATLALAASWPAVLGLRFADRVGKGLRSPPRDALLADSVEPRYRGRAFGLHRGLDTMGAVIGPLVAYGMLNVVHGDARAHYTRIFAVSAIPALVSIGVLALFVRAPRHTPARLRKLHHELRAMGGTFHRFLTVEGLFQLANSSMAFVLLRNHDVGLSAAQVVLAYLAYNLVQALLSLPLGDLSDRIGRRPLLLVGYLLYAVTYGALALAPTALVAVGGLVALGVHNALIDGQKGSMIADLVPQDRRATAYGFYYTVVGLALLPASVLTGWLWDHAGAGTAFGVDAALALCAAGLFALLLPGRRERQERGDAATV
jgi:MFS family permease